MNPKELKLIRLLLGIIVIILILFALFIFMAIPSVNYYKKQNSIHTQVKAEFDSVSEMHQATLNTLVDLKGENRRAIDAFANDFDDKKFLNYLNSMFEDIEFEKTQANNEEKFLRYNIKVTTSMDTPMKFYKFLTDINSYSNILEAQFPIEFEIVEGKLVGGFSLKKYHYKIQSK